MKKFKKIFAVLLTLAMVLGMSMTSFAATDNGKINVTGLKKESTKVSIYNIVKLDSNDNAWEVAPWAKDVTGAIDATEDPYTINASALQAALTASVVADESKTVENGTVSFEGLEAGVYLVIAETQVSGSTTTYNPMLAVTYAYDDNNIMVGGTANVVAKSANIQVDKAADTDDTYVAVGMDAGFKINTTFPSFHADDGSNTTGTYKITDTPVGLSIKADTIQVSVGGTVLETSNYTATVDQTSGVMTIEFTSAYIGSTNEHAGAAVEVKYEATVTEATGIKNTANAIVDGSTVGTDEENVYTGTIEMTKTDEAGNGLSGAEFIVYTVRGGSNQYAIIEDGVVTGWTDQESKASHITTGTDGKVSVVGLDADETYKFKEVVAPDGYSINATDSTAAWTELAGSAPAGDRTGTASMTDTKLSSLPSTGGIGTTIFTIGGCAIMIIAAALFFASRRKAAK